jgi:hypothetical protein
MKFSAISNHKNFIMTRYILLISIFLSHTISVCSQNDWTLRAAPVSAANYYGVTVANGMIGIVSAPEPFKVQEVVLAGAYDRYGRGRVSNFLRSFNLLNMRIDVDGQACDKKTVSNFMQELNMREASFHAGFDHSDKASISYSYYALRQLPFTVLMDVTIKARKDITINAASVMEAPEGCGKLLQRDRSPTCSIKPAYINCQKSYRETAHVRIK